MSPKALDIGILLEFLSPNESESLRDSAVSAQLASLESLTSMCSDSDAVDSLRNLDGINLIWNLCCSSKSVEVAHACLFALSCAAQSNVFAQQELSHDRVFQSLNKLILSDELNIKTKVLVTYFLLSLVSKNKQGQALICKSGCLDSLSSLFVKCTNLCNSDLSLDELAKHVELWMVVSKTLSYSATVPQNLDNQKKLCKILPWLITGIHTVKQHKDLLRLLCTFLSVIVEGNKDGQKSALECRAVEVLILVISRLNTSDNNECLGDAVAALNHVLPDENGEHWGKFAVYGGSSLLLELVEKIPSEHWETYHINQTLALLSKCVEVQSDVFDDERSHLISQKIIKLMSAITDDEYFNKISVHLLNLLLESNKSPEELSNANIRLPKSVPNQLVSQKRTDIAKCSSTIFNDLDHDFFQPNDVCKKTSQKKFIESIFETECGVQPHITCRSYTTILLNTQRSNTGEVVLDISSSNKDALRASSGILASPTEKVFNRHSLPMFRKTDQYGAEDLFLNPAPQMNHASTTNVSSQTMVHPEKRAFCSNKSKKYFYSEPTPSTSHSLSCRLIGGYLTPNKRKPAKDIDVMSLCGDLIEREVLQSVKKHRGFQGHLGCSGSLLHN